MTNSRTVTLLTDFGLRDHYAAAMKGVMLSINPALQFVDISHSIPPQDIQSGAFTLGHAYPWFPAGTIHIAVVDPGVGTSRKAMLVAAASQVFIAPDNGLLSYVFQQEESWTAYEITEDHYFRKPVSPTFHGRDIFAPVAAWVSREIPLQKLGPVLGDPVRLKIPSLTRVRDALIQAAVLAVDSFGNLVTNLKPQDLPGDGRAWKILVAQREITGVRRTFAEGEPGEVFVVPGSSGYLEIVMKNGSAASTLNIGPGAPVGVVLS
jgi:S-adenosylmethionine hydrolase